MEEPGPEEKDNEDAVVKEVEGVGKVVGVDAEADVEGYVFPSRWRGDDVDADANVVASASSSYSGGGSYEECKPL